MVVFGEVWHAVLDHRDNLEQQDWGDDGDVEGQQAQQAQQPKGDPYKGAWEALGGLGMLIFGTDRTLLEAATYLAIAIQGNACLGRHAAEPWH